MKITPASYVNNFGRAFTTQEKKAYASLLQDARDTLQIKDTSAIVFDFNVPSNKGENVLLSPACASFDMFKNFEQRGKVFCKIVRELEKSENRKIPNKKNKENKI